MKKFFAILALALVAFVACTPNDEPNNEPNNGGGTIAATDLDGQWHIVEWNNEKPAFDVYLSFDKGSFDIYQQVYSLYYVNYDGTYSVNGAILSGTYSYGSKWACDYDFEVKELELEKEGKTYKAKCLILNSRESSSIKSVYEACKIPQSIIDEASKTRACEFTPFL